MNKEGCVAVSIGIPDFVLTLFWIFVTVALLTATGAIIVSVSNYLFELYQDRRAAYLRNKQTKLELELYAERQKDDR